MKSFKHIVQDPLGLHARPVGMLVMETKKYKSQITISNGGKEAKSTQMMQIMSMGIKAGAEITFTIEGPDEDTAFEELQAFCKEKV